MPVSYPLLSVFFQLMWLDVRRRFQSWLGYETDMPKLALTPYHRRGRSIHDCGGSRNDLTQSAEVWSRLRAFWRAAAGQPSALKRSAFFGELLALGRMHDSENIDWSVAGGHVALCISYSNTQTSVRSRRSSPRTAAAAVLKLLLPALKVGVTMRLAHEREVEADLSLARFALTKREAQIARLLARRASNREIAEQLDVSPRTVRHHIENIFAKLGVPSRRSIVQHLE